MAKENRWEIKGHQTCDSIVAEPFHIWATLEFRMVVSIIVSLSVSVRQGAALSASVFAKAATPNWEMHY